MPNRPIKFKFSLLQGDLINALAGIRHVCERERTTAEIYLGLNIEWRMSEDISKGRESHITLTEKTMEMLRPLLLNQSYISKVDSLEAVYPEEYHKWIGAFKYFSDFDYAARWYMENPSALVDLDKHHVMPIGLPYGSIFRWNWYCYPDMTCDLSKPWLFVEPNELIPSDAIIVNRTERAQNQSLSYSFLKEYEKRLFFVGLDQEYKKFCSDWDLNIGHLIVKDFLELASIIRSAKCFIGNQSLCFSLAEALKVPRVLEVCPYLPNVIPTGEWGFDIYFQSTLEWSIKELAKTKTDDDWTKEFMVQSGLSIKKP